MNSAAEEKDLAPENDDVTDVINPNGVGPFLLVCEHASHFIPERFGGLGLSAEVQCSHVAWDPGALEVAKRMSRLLDAPLVAQKVSRLVYDCNRPPDAPSAMAERSEIYDIPGNRGLSPDEREVRIAHYYLPFRKTVTDQLDLLQARVAEPVLITIHSFTPVYFGQKRDTEIGVLHDRDSRFAHAILTALKQRTELRLGENKPYGPYDGVTHTLIEHALPRGMANVMIEIRNDLVADEEGQAEMAQLLSEAARSAHHDLKNSQSEAS